MPRLIGAIFSYFLSIFNPLSRFSLHFLYYSTMKNARCWPERIGFHRHFRKLSMFASYWSNESQLTLSLLFLFTQVFPPNLTNYLRVKYTSLKEILVRFDVSFGTGCRMSEFTERASFLIFSQFSRPSHYYWVMKDASPRCAAILEGIFKFGRRSTSPLQLPHHLTISSGDTPPIRDWIGEGERESEATQTY